MSGRRKFSFDPIPLIAIVIIALIAILVSRSGDNIDSEVDQVTASLAPPRTESSIFVTLRSGSEGVDVTILQNRLNSLGFSVGVDGMYGSDTVAAIMAFQKLSNLTANGVADEKTQIMLFSSSAPTAPPDYKVVEANEQADYIGNSYSNKFHYSWCSSVADMSSSNRVPFDSRSEAIEFGYKPCSRCNP